MKAIDRDQLGYYYCPTQNPVDVNINISEGNGNERRDEPRPTRPRLDNNFLRLADAVTKALLLQDEEEMNGEETESEEEQPDGFQDNYGSQQWHIDSPSPSNCTQLTSNNSFVSMDTKLLLLESDPQTSS